MLIIGRDGAALLSEPERALLESKFVEIPREWGREPSLERVWNYEAQQPPLYYLLCAPFMVLLRNASLATQIFTLRFVGVVVASLAVPLAREICLRTL